MGVFLLVIGLIVVGAGIWAISYRRREEMGPPVAVGVLVVLIGIGAFFSSFVSVVDARAVGIQTSLGKYQDTLPSGLNLTAPWSSVESWTTRNQTLRFAGDGRSDERDNYFTEPFVTVRLGNQSEAYVDVTITWTVGDAEKDKEGIRSLWQQYKTFNDMRQDFATPTAQGAVNTAFDGYDPFKGLNDKNVDNPYVPLADWSRKIQDILNPLYAARGLHLVNVQATKVAYDKRTEDKLREYADAVANTRIKAQDVLTAEQEALASKARATQAAPGCEALIRDLAAKDQLKNLPAGWQCPNQGSTPPVIVGK